MIPSRLVRRRNPPLGAPPPFDLSVSPILGNACLDKMRIRVEGYSVHCRDRGALESFLRNLVGMDRVFERGFGNRLWKLDIAKRGWHFTGTIHFKRPQSGGAFASDIVFDLELNPTRFFANRPYEVTELGTLLPEEVLRRDGGRLAPPTLDGKDNMLSPERMRAVLPGYQSATVYIMLVIEFIVRRLGSATDRYAVESPSSRRDDAPRDYDIVLNQRGTVLTIPYAEVYWEYTCRDAVSLVHRLYPRLRAKVMHSTLGDHGNPAQGERRGRYLDYPNLETENNAITTRIGLGHESIELAAYAKATERIRFEVRFLENVRQLMGSRGTSREIGRGIDHLPVLLEEVVMNAHRRFSTLFTTLGDIQHEEGRSFPTLTRFYQHLFAATNGNGDMASDLASLLASIGGVSLSGDAVFDAAVRELVDRRVLQAPHATLRPRTEKYELTPEYRQTLLDLFPHRSVWEEEA